MIYNGEIRHGVSSVAEKPVVVEKPKQAEPTTDEKPVVKNRRKK